MEAALTELASKRDFVICGSIVCREDRMHGSTFYKTSDKVLSQTIVVVEIF